MAQHASAEKRNRQNQVRNARNTAARSSMRTAVKSARSALTDKAVDRQAALKAAVSSIYRAAAKNIIKKGTAERRVSRLMKAFAKTSA